MITLDTVTRIDAASDFFGAGECAATSDHDGRRHDSGSSQNHYPGVRRKQIGDRRQDRRRRSHAAIPATFLQRHPNTDVLLDAAAAAALTRTRLPWLVSNVQWEPSIIRRAVIWLSEKMSKSILKLTDSDYNEEGLQDLLAEYGSAYEINLIVFRHLQSTIIGWPAGKPAHKKRPGDRPQPFDHIFPKRILCFSPHPDDDVISMGGTLIRLAAQGHEVHIAYQTSGNIAVFDDDAIRFTEFVSDYCAAFGLLSDRIQNLEDHVEEYLKKKQAGQIDSKEIQQIKGLIRRGEARAGARCCGVPNEKLHFLDMPFYETGGVKKKPLGPDDIKILVDLMREVRPHQIYAAGDLSDPHGTHRTCLKAIIEACDRMPQRRLVSKKAKSGCTAVPGRNGPCIRSKWPCRSARRK